MNKMILCLFCILLATSAMANTQAQNQAALKGCTLDTGDDQVCRYPEKLLKGSEAIEKFNELLQSEVGKTTYVEGNVEKCVVKWSSVALENWSLNGPKFDAPVFGDLTFIDPVTGRPLLQFWFAKELQYTYQYVDKAFALGEDDFWVDHIFKVQGPANKKYEVVIYKDGDAAAGLRMTANGQQKNINEFCETEF